MTQQLLPTETVRRYLGASRFSGLGQVCVYGGGAATTKINNNVDELALPATAGGAVGVSAAWSDEPMPRADHKAKRHSRPVSRKYKRQPKRKLAAWDDLP